MYQARITASDGTVRLVPLQENRTEHGFELVLSKDILSSPTEYVDFPEDYAPAYEGEDGYFAAANYLFRFTGHEDAEYNTGYTIMPFFGVKTPRACFVCIVTGLPEQHSFIVRRTEGVYTIHARFRLDGQPAEEDMKAEYRFLSCENADYSGMARAYREYQLNRGACVRLRDRMNEHISYLLDAPEIRIRLAWKPVPTPVEEQTPETEPPLHVAVDFDRVEEIMKACKAHGVDQAEFCLVGWNKSGHDGRWPTAFPVEEQLGGEEKLRALIRGAKEMGYRMVCHTNATDCYSISDVWSENLPMRDRSGAVQKNGQWGGGRMYNMCPLAGGEQYSAETLLRVHELGFEGLHYIDVVGVVRPYRCFSEEHPCSQKQFIASMCRLARLSSELMGGFQSEGCYDHMAGVMDMALYIDFSLLAKKPHALCDENVPLWQLVYHDIVLSNAGPTTVNYPVKDWLSRLKFIEYGCHPAIYIHSKFLSNNAHWMGTEDFTAGTPEEIGQSAALIRQSLDDYRAVQDLALTAMVRHEHLTDSIVCVTYENGARILCNYGEDAYCMDGTVVPPHDFIVLRP